MPLLQTATTAVVENSACFLSALSDILGALGVNRLSQIWTGVGRERLLNESLTPPLPQISFSEDTLRFLAASCGSKVLLQVLLARPPC